MGWLGGGGGGTLKLLLLCIHCEIHIKSQHRSLVQVLINYVATTRTLNCTRNAVEKEYKRIHYFHYYFAFQHSHYITHLAAPAKILLVQN